MLHHQHGRAHLFLGHTVNLGFLGCELVLKRLAFRQIFALCGLDGALFFCQLLLYLGQLMLQNLFAIRRFVGEGGAIAEGEDLGFDVGQVLLFAGRCGKAAQVFEVVERQGFVVAFISRSTSRLCSNLAPGLRLPLLNTTFPSRFKASARSS